MFGSAWPPKQICSQITVKDPGHCCTVPWGVRAHGKLVKTKTLSGNLQQTIKNKALCSSTSRWKVRKSFWDSLPWAGIQVLWLWMEQPVRNLLCLLLKGERLHVSLFRGAEQAEEAACAVRGLAGCRQPQEKQQGSWHIGKAGSLPQQGVFDVERQS